MSDELDDLDALRQLVRQYRMHWASAPEYAVAGDVLQPIGYNIELSAAHARHAHAPSPGCPECVPVLEALQRVSEFMLPKEERNAYYEVNLRPAHEFSKNGGGQPEMTSRVTILHRGDPNRPPDPCETRCRDEILAKLKVIGAPEGAWHGTSSGG